MKTTIDLWHKAWPDPGAFVRASAQDLEMFAALVRAAEREACAKVCDDRAFQFFSESPFFVEMHDLADAIRNRGKHEQTK